MAPEQEIGRAPVPIPLSSAVALALLVIAELGAVVAVVAIWRERHGSRWAKVLWTLITLLPLLGLVAFLVWRDPPPPNGPTDRQPGRDWGSP
jgi:hypothetical protein